eukprot:CAMPEP_0114251626 /NCGR_PEP_ID=MMETSP0058-20121206/15375_1 /TAXON_ID=36894 /ORGANISM="Pyramimonas parkeae, CCMP726" /LENGTH=174 /DNA_ID=CAMNT_0001365449 /DNA_START=343 /DNA_END=867 /DNA_ORIENTATION=-
MAFLAGGEESLYDQNKCIKMALAHDLAEAVVGDITPHDNVPKEDKQRMEREAMQNMCAELGSAAAQQLMDLWEEYEAGSSPEAVLLKDLDKLEMILQAHEYEKDQSITLNEFFNSTEGKFRTKTGQAWAVEIYKRRAAAARAGNESPSGSTKAQARFQGNVPESIPDQKKQRTD